jgi:hypothetical protein
MDWKYDSVGRASLVKNGVHLARVSSSLHMFLKESPLYVYVLYIFNYVIFVRIIYSFMIIVNDSFFFLYSLIYLY